MAAEPLVELKPGDRVVRGPDWEWDDQDVIDGCRAEGTVVAWLGGGGSFQLSVRWDGKNGTYYYRRRPGKIDVVPAPPKGPPAAPDSPDNPYRKLLEDHWPKFAWLRTQDVLRAPLTTARLGVPFDPAWDGLDDAALKDALAAALQAARPFPAGTPAIQLFGGCRDPGWLSVRPASGMSQTATAARRRATVEIQVEVREPRVRRTREWFTRTYEGTLELDRERVLEFVRDGDQEGLEDYIRDEIVDGYCDLPEDDGDIDDSTTDDDDATGDDIDYGRGSDPARLAERLMEDLEEEAHEGEDEE